MPNDAAWPVTQALLPWELDFTWAPRCTDRAVVRPEAAEAAFEEHRLGVAFQPVVGLSDGGVLYQEALARIATHPTQSERMALIARLEKEGSIHRLDVAVLALGAAHLGRDPRLRIGVNLSCRTVDAMGAELPACIEALGPLAARLVLEITETAPLADRRRLHCLVDCARRVGCAIAFDDYGAGWFSLEDIAEFKPDIVKLDGAFFKRAFHGDDVQCFADLHALVAAQPIQLVAEHVETHEMAEFARANDIPYAQGYHIAEPQRLRL